MVRTGFWRYFVAAILICSFTAGERALAERVDRGGGRGARANSSGGGQSLSGSRGGGGRSRSGGAASHSGSSARSSRSFSGSSARSFSGNSSRSFSQGGNSPRSISGNSARSFSRGSEAARAFSNGRSRSLRSGERSNVSGGRTFQGRSSISGTPDSSPANIRSFNGRSTRETLRRLQNEGGSRSTVSRGDNSFRGFTGRAGASEKSASRNLRRGSVDTSQFGRSFDNIRNRQLENASALDARRRTNNESSNRVNSEIRRRRGLQELQANENVGRREGNRFREVDSNRSRRLHTTGRPSDDRIREFLELRRDNAAGRTGSLGNPRFDDNSLRRQGQTSATGRGSQSDRRTSVLRDRVADTQARGDRAWSKRFGHTQRDGIDRVGIDRSLRGVERDPRDGREGGSRFADSNRRGDGHRVGNRDFGDRHFVDDRYRKWRRHAWGGKRDHGFDHRDRSGRWKDGDRFVAAHRIRDHWKKRGHGKHAPFRGGWWKDHHRHHRHWHHWDHWARHYHRPYYWWSWTTAPLLTNWFVYDWATPYYWDYGPGEYIWCDGNVIFVNGAWFQPAPIYYENTLVLAQRAPNWTAEEAAQVEWLPLGVFVVARDGVADENVLVQLAVTKDGVIGGTVFNQPTGETFAVEGIVDKETQRAVWSYVDENNTRIAMETSIFNLTQAEATGLIHYGPDDIQVIELVRLEEPTAEE